MESNTRVLLSARVAEHANRYALIEIRPGFDDAPWSMELYHEISSKMGPERAAAYVTERYLLDHPFQLTTVGREAISQAVLQVLVSIDK